MHILLAVDLMPMSHWFNQIVNFYASQVLSTECDMPSLHQYLTRIPSELSNDDWEEIIRRSLHLFRSHHPDSLDRLNDEWKKKW